MNARRNFPRSAFRHHRDGLGAVAGFFPLAEPDYVEHLRRRSARARRQAPPAAGGQDRNDAGR